MLEFRFRRVNFRASRSIRLFSLPTSGTNPHPIPTSRASSRAHVLPVELLIASIMAKALSSGSRAL